jgi:hypothetical protein
LEKKNSLIFQVLSFSFLAGWGKIILFCPPGCQGIVKGKRSPYSRKDMTEDWDVSTDLDWESEAGGKNGKPEIF